jgi:hypothetical protein
MSNKRIMRLSDKELTELNRMTVNKLVELVAYHAKFLVEIEDTQKLRELLDDTSLTQEEIDSLDRGSLIREIIRQDFLLSNDVELPHDAR